MNMIQAFNRTIDYIEEIINAETGGEINGKEIARRSGYSLAMFSRIFSILTGMPLSEYVRRRKMTLAAVELLSSKRKVIDLAIRYGYESADSFTVAFKTVHGITPSEIRIGKQGKIYSKLKLHLSISGGNEMNGTIQRKAAFKIAGVGENEIASANCPAVWDKLFKLAGAETLEKLGSGQSFGMCHDIQTIDKINYFAGYDVKDEAAAKALGLTVVNIPENEYAVVELTGKIPDSIHAGWAFIMKEFLPEHGCRHSGAPDFEVYRDGDMYSDDYRMELWVPIKKE